MSPCRAVKSIFMNIIIMKNIVTFIEYIHEEYKNSTPALLLTD